MKEFFIVLICFLSVLPFRVSAYALINNDLVKSPEFSAVYYVQNGNRYAFPFYTVYQAYFGDDFTRLKIITTNELAQLPLAGNVLLPADSLIKIISSPDVYRVIKQNNVISLQLIPSEAEAINQFGSNWARNVIDVPVEFYTDYHNPRGSISLDNSVIWKDNTPVADNYQLTQDWDNDGYSINQGDCNDFNRNIAPNHVEFPDDLLDNDCDGQINEINNNWQSAINSLYFSNYKKSIDDEGVMTLTNEIFRVILPNPDAENYGKYMLSQAKVCHEDVKSFLGQDPNDTPKLTNQPPTILDYKLTWDFTANQISPPMYPDKDGTIFIKYDSEIALGQKAFWKSEGINYNICHDGHEELHRFLPYILMPHWGHEGLATYFQLRNQTRQGVPRSPFNWSSPIYCADTGYKFNLYDTTVVPYTNVSIYSYTNGYYYTGKCFWDKVFESYGEDSLKPIIQRMYDLTYYYDLTQDFAKIFLMDSIKPTIGAGISPFLNTIGYNNDYLTGIGFFD